MKLTSFPKAAIAIGLMTTLVTIASTNIKQTAQAQTAEATQSTAACSEDYFNDPDHLYDYYSLDLSETMSLSSQQSETIEQASVAVGEQLAAISTEITTFSVKLDAPIGYIVKEESGEAVEIPPEIENAINQALSTDDVAGRRDEVKVLNDKYGQYATFGQQITLIFSPEQIARVNEDYRKFNAIVKDTLTEAQKKMLRDSEKSAGICSNNMNFGALGRLVVEVGQRPELDQRLREDTSNTILFD